MKLKVTEKLRISLDFGQKLKEPSPEVENIIIRNNEFINNLYSKLIDYYQKAEKYENFEDNFFLLWYSIKGRRSFIPLVDRLFDHHQIEPPAYFLADKALYSKMLNKDTSNEEQREENEDDTKYLRDVIEIGQSRLEVYSNESKDLNVQLEDELKNELHYNKVLKIWDAAEKLVGTASNYRNYLICLKPLYLMLYEIEKNPSSFEFSRGYITYVLPLKRGEWKDIIPKVSALTLQSVDTFSKDEVDEYNKEEELLKRYKDENYIVRPFVFNRNYAMDEREKFIIRALDLLKSEPTLYDFISDSVEKQVMGLLSAQKKFIKAMETYKAERVTIYQDLIKEIKSSNFYKNLSEQQKIELDSLNESSVIIYTEGNNIRYLERAREFFKPNLKVKFYNMGGKNEMRTLFDYFVLNNHNAKSIFLFDCDVTSEYEHCLLKRTERILPIRMNKNDQNKKIKVGIENLFNEELFTSDFYISNTSVDNYGATKIIEKLDKNKFCKYVCEERNNPDDFRNFKPVIEEIEKLIFSN